MKSPNFTLWLLNWQKSAQNHLRKRYIDVICQADFNEWLMRASPPTSEIREIVTSIKIELGALGKNPSSESLRKRLYAQLDILLKRLP
jgi:hypothetical protein